MIVSSGMITPTQGERTILSSSLSSLSIFSFSYPAFFSLSYPSFSPPSLSPPHPCLRKKILWHARKFTSTTTSLCHSPPSGYLLAISSSLSTTTAPPSHRHLLSSLFSLSFLPSLSMCAFFPCHDATYLHFSLSTCSPLVSLWHPLFISLHMPHLPSRAF